MQRFKRKNRSMDPAGNQSGFRRMLMQCKRATRLVELNMDSFRNSMRAVETCISDAGVDKWSAHEVVLVPISEVESCKPIYPDYEGGLRHSGAGCDTVLDGFGELWRRR